VFGFSQRRMLSVSVCVGLWPTPFFASSDRGWKAAPTNHLKPNT
jgi:hypothetical protein